MSLFSTLCSTRLEWNKHNYTSMRNNIIVDSSKSRWCPQRCKQTINYQKAILIYLSVRIFSCEVRFCLSACQYVWCFEHRYEATTIVCQHSSNSQIYRTNVCHWCALLLFEFVAIFVCLSVEFAFHFIQSSRPFIRSCVRPIVRLLYTFFIL